MATTDFDDAEMMRSIPRRMSLSAALDEAAERWGPEEAWIFDEERFTFDAMRRLSLRAAAGLSALGVQSGDMVATWMGNRSEWLALLFGCARIGAVLVPLNTRSSSREAAFCLAHCGAAVLFYTPTIFRVKLEASVAELMKSSASARADSPRLRLRHVVSVGLSALNDVLRWEDVLGADLATPHGAAVQPVAVCAPDDPLLLQYTSGTTANPKGALLSHTHVLNRGVEGLHRLGMRRGDRLFNTQPIYHIGGSCAAMPVPLTLGCCIVTTEYYDPERTLQLISRERCIARTGFAAMYLTEMDHPRFDEFDLSCLRYAWCIGPRAIVEKVRDRYGLTSVIQLFSSTEVAGTCGDIADPEEKRMTTCGRPITGMEVRIVDGQTRQPVPAGQSGEISIRGWGQLMEYLHDPVQTTKALDADGWFYTGDLGRLDEDGYLEYRGRLKDMLKPGGENVSAEEVEAILCEHPKVKQAAVIGAPDPRLGEVVMAIVEPVEGSELTEEELVEYCRGVMAKFRVPRYVRFISQWPMTASGKIKKTVLRDMYRLAS